MILRAYVFQKLKTAKDVVKHMSKKKRSRISIDSQHIKESQAKLKYVWQHLCHILYSL